MKKVFLALALLGLVACKKEATTDVPINHDSTETVIADTIPPLQSDTDSELVKHVSKINHNRSVVISQLRNAPPEEANRLYEKLKDENNQVISRLQNLEQNILDGYYTHFSGPDAKPDKIVSGKLAVLAKADLEIWDIGEGMAEIRTVPDYYKKIFSGRVTDDYNEYINLIAFDDKELYQADAAIAIPWAQLGDRVVNWENFIAAHPDSKLVKNAKEWYKLYLYAFINGYDNTPTGEGDSEELYPEVKEAFQQFVKKYPSSPVTPYVILLLESRENTEKANTDLKLTPMI